MTTATIDTVFNLNNLSNFESDDGDVRSLGYSLLDPSSFTFTDFAMYKTRNGRIYSHQIEVLLGPEFNDITLDNCLLKLESKFPNIRNIIERESKISNTNYIRDNYYRQNISGTVIKPLNTLCLFINAPNRSAPSSNFLPG